MKGYKNLLFGITGILFIAVSLKSLLIDSSDEYMKMIGGVLFGLFLMYPIFKKNNQTDVEKFIESKNIIGVIWWKRLITFFIDFIILLFFYSITMIFILKLFETRLDKLYNPLFLFSPFVVFYYTIQEYLFQTTLGKLPFKLKVISTKSNPLLKKEAGSNPTFFQILIRSLTRLVFVVDIFFFLFKRPIGLHDITSKTIVTHK